MRLIDADALMQDVIAHSYPLTNAFSVGGVDDGMFTNGFQQVVDEQPTIDAVPVVHGEWIFKKPPDDWVLSLYECSVCHHMEEGQPNYCPNCGAKMKGENDEQIH